MIPAESREEKALRQIRRLIWLYFWLLLFEGALRKWVLPQLSNPLLIIRDPVVLLIYLLAIRARVFPRNAWMLSLGVIAFLSAGGEFHCALALFPAEPDRPCHWVWFPCELPSLAVDLSDAARAAIRRCEANRMVDAASPRADVTPHGRAVSRRARRIA